MEMRNLLDLSHRQSSGVPDLTPLS